MRSKLVPSATVVAALSMLTWTTAQACPACGDKLSIAGGVGFERVNDGPPGRIVVLAEPGSALQAAETELGLAARLERSGHEVQVVDNSSDLDRVVRERGADVVVAHWTEAASTADRIGRVDGAPTVVAVSYKSTDAAEATAAGVEKCVCQADQRKGKKLVETIDKVLDKRRKGEPADCTPVNATGAT
jgi:hypothetical protein